ncbi:MAG: hypothetical protein M3Y22_09295 [Pseudomonadota bacterium]|nr:hypothetical protein [Pseudomonadota bacterium]
MISAQWPARVTFALPLPDDDDVLPLHLLEEIAQTVRAGNATLLLSPDRGWFRRVKDGLAGFTSKSPGSAVGPRIQSLPT